jgi:hypothetical protein
MTAKTPISFQHQRAASGTPVAGEIVTFAEFERALIRERVI